MRRVGKRGREDNPKGKLLIALGLKEKEKEKEEEEKEEEDERDAMKHAQKVTKARGKTIKTLAHIHRGLYSAIK